MSMYSSWMVCTSLLKLSRVVQFTTGWGRLFHNLTVSGKKDRWNTRVLAKGTRNLFVPMSATGDATPENEMPIEEVKETLLSCLRDYDGQQPGIGRLAVRPLKIKYCNGATPLSFSDAFCAIEQSQYLFWASALFQPGIVFLRNFLNGDNTDLPHDKQIAVDRLLSFFSNIKGVSRQMSKEHEGASSNSKRDSDWFILIQLVHHILQPLAVEPYYIMDKYSVWFNRCWCCNEVISGDHADTSMGHEKVWHGSANILMGQRSLALNLTDNLVEDPDEEMNPEMTPVYETSLRNNAPDIIAETIVFAFLQKKIRSTSAQNFLIPTIGISKKHIMLYFYDPEFDILLQSCRPLPIWSAPGKLSPHTMLDLWLVINYLLTCSGITKGMFDLGYKADFMANFDDDDVKYIYEKRLRFGDCRNTQTEDDYCEGYISVLPGGPPKKGKYAELTNKK